MKKTLLICLVVVLAMLMFPTAVVSATDNDINGAQKAATKWTEYIASTVDGLSTWKDAKATCSQLYEDLKGNVNAYMFTIVSSKGVVGHMLIGSADYNYTVFEAGESMPPTIPSNETARKAIETLGISTKDYYDLKPTKILYLGLDNQYALYDINDEEIAINLVFSSAKPLAKIETTLPSPAEYQAALDEISGSSGKKLGVIESDGSKTTKDLNGYGYGCLTMSYYNAAGQGLCGPCSGTSILQYYRDVRGYTNLSINSYLYVFCYIGMRCDQYYGATMPGYYGNGIACAAQDAGYYCFNSYLDTSVSFSDYECVVNDINSGWPTALCIVAQWHWRAIRGYTYNTSSDYYKVICTNSATSSSYELVDWLTMGFSNQTVAVKDNG